MSDACAEIAERFDPDLHRAAMFAPEPLRGRLMVLIAFDVELSRGAARASEPMISAMRLQWWRDVVAEAQTGQARAHDVAGPLAALIRACDLPAAPFEALIATREAELRAPFSGPQFDAWLDGRVAPLLALGAACAGAPPIAVRDVGRGMALSFALRNAVAMAGDGVFLMPFAGLDRAALARGQTTDSQRRVIASLAEAVLHDLNDARKSRVPRSLGPVLRLGYRSERLLRAATGPAFDLAAARSLSGGGTARLLRLSLTGGW